MKNLNKIFTLPKWSKVFLIAISTIAVVLLIATYALQSWADNKIESANLTFSKIDKNKSIDLENEYAYEARVHFPRLDFLLRSKSISHIDLVNIAWDSNIINSNTIIHNIETHNRRLTFISTQKLDLDSNTILGTMSYKMDFGVVPVAIILYYLQIVFAIIFVAITLSISKIFTQNNREFLWGGVSPKTTIYLATINSTKSLSLFHSTYYFSRLILYFLRKVMI